MIAPPQPSSSASDVAPSFGSRARAWLARPSVVVWTALAAIALTAPAWWSGFAADDYFIRAIVLQDGQVPGVSTSRLDAFSFTTGGAELVADAVEEGVLPWWTYPDVQVAFWRPLAALTHVADFALFPGSPFLMHVLNSLWYAALAVVVAVLYRRLGLPLWVAGLAALMYAADDARGMGVGWIANRNGIMAAFLGLSALLAHDMWRRDGRRAAMPVAWACLALGLLSGESAVAVGGYLFAYACFVDPRGFRRGFAALLPYAAIVVAWRLIYVSGGYACEGTALYIDPAGQPGAFLQTLPAHLAVLMLGQFGLPSSGLWSVSPGWAETLILAVGAPALIWAAWTLTPMLRRNRTAAFLGLGCLLAAIPPCATLPNDRLLFFVGFGAMGLVALLIGAWFDQRDQLSRSARILACAWIAIHAVHGPVTLPATVLTPLGFGRPLQWAADTLAEEMAEAQAAAGETADGDVRPIVLNTPADLMMAYMPFMHAADGRDPVLGARLLTAGYARIHLLREDERTLRVRLEGGWMNRPWARIFRDDTHPLLVGDTVHVADMTAEVVETTSDGRPLEVRFRFDAPLESPRYRWLNWGARGFEPFTPPKVGEAQTVERLPFFWWV